MFSTKFIANNKCSTKMKKDEHSVIMKNNKVDTLISIIGVLFCILAIILVSFEHIFLLSLLGFTIIILTNKIE